MSLANFTLGSLLTERTLRHIDAAIEANRAEAGSLVRDHTPESGKRMDQLNRAWIELETGKQRLTGIDPAPYRMGRS